MISVVEATSSVRPASWLVPNIRLGIACSIRADALRATLPVTTLSPAMEGDCATEF
jgi:hypothetical protein